MAEARDHMLHWAETEQHHLAVHRSITNTSVQVQESNGGMLRSQPHFSAQLLNSSATFSSFHHAFQFPKSEPLKEFILHLHDSKTVIDYIRSK